MPQPTDPPWRVFVTRQLPGHAFADLRRDPHFQLDIWPHDNPPPPDALRQHAQGAHGLICLITDTIDDELLDAAGPQLQVVSQMAVGVDNIDTAACAQRAIAVGNTPGVLTDTTADIAIALLLATARRIVEAADYVKHGHWQTWSPTTLAGADVHGASLGIIGFGAIGQAVARRAHGFDMRVRYWNRTPRPQAAQDLHTEYAQFDDLLRTSDFISINIALTPDTHHLIDARALSLMPPHAMLINTARGPIVDEHALTHALQHQHIAGAGLDVTETEPIDPHSPLLSMPNVVVLPHIGSASNATRAKMADIAVHNLRAALQGDPLPHPVNTPGTPQ